MENLIGQIEAAFATRPYPGDENITCCSYDKKNGGDFNGPCSECVEMAEYFRGKSWRELTAAELFQEGQCDALFTVAAYCYFLPAFLIAAIREPEEADVCVDKLAYRFGPKDGDDWGTSRAAAIVAQLGAEERDATLTYFRFAMSLEDDFDDYCSRAIHRLTLPIV
jgi:hypothetical protein